MQRTDRSVASIHTRAGRTIDVAILPLPGVPVNGTVTLSLRCASFDNHERVWLSLSVAEAALLGNALAQAAERVGPD